MMRVIMLIPAVAILLACGLIARIDDSAKVQATGDIVVGPAPGGGSTASSVAGDLALPLYAGDSLIEEKIISYPVVVKATMTSFSSDTFLYPDGTFRPVLQFNLDVSEYLKGTGPSSIVAVWFYGRPYDTRAGADSRREAILEERDAQWDDREAIFFLVDGPSVGPSPLLSTQPQLANQYVLGLGDKYSPDDRYSLHSKSNKRWLPAASTSSTGDEQEFLLDVPPPTETVTLGDLKTWIAGATETPLVPAEDPAAYLDGLIPSPSADAATGKLPTPVVVIPSNTVLPLYARDLPRYVADDVIEERVINTTVIVRAATRSLSSEVVEADGGYAVALKFNLAVSEYLKGTGPSNIVAMWIDSTSYDTQERADNRKAVIFAERGRGMRADAIFFLYGDGPEFLLDMPPPVESITLGELKRKITEVTAELNGGDGSERYRECVLEKYQHIRNQRNWPEERGNPYGVWDLDYSLVSGLPAGTVLDWRQLHGDDPIADYESPIRFEGRDADLFDTVVTESTILEMAGEYVETKYVEIVRLARPLPAGEYRFDLKEPRPRYAICNFVISNEWTVTATAPDGTLHEAFFDPVTDGGAVAADSANGVLEPASFTDAGATTTIERIEWEAGTATMKLTPHTALAGRVVDFIELDGKVSLSLIVDEATVDTANNTLSWSVSPQPWEDGDKLMVRIR